MKIGILTSGGDCPGLNAVIRGSVLKGVISHDAEFVGFRWGWKGVVEGDFIPITRHDVRGLSKQGGTILGSSRTNPFEGEGSGPENIQRMLDANGIDAIIAIGGEGTLTAARRLTDAGLKIVGVPKTIDNDLAATDYSFGFDTAVEIATEAIDRVHRIGQDEPVTAWRIIAAHTIDARIAELIDSKQGLAARALDGSDVEPGSADSVQLDALQHLLRRALDGAL